MPTYDYKCQACGQITEEFHLLMSEAPQEIWCPYCTAIHREVDLVIPIAKRIISPGASFTFKQPGGTNTGAKKEAEVQAAMRDFSSGKKESH